MKKSFWSWLIMSLLMISFASGQQATIDSLETILKEHLEQDSFRAKVLIDLGNAYTRVDLERALEVSDEAVLLSQEIPFLSAEGTAYQLKGIVFSHQGDYKSALQSYWKALDIRKIAGDSSGIAQNLSNIAGIFYAQGDYKKALEYSQQALVIAHRINDELVIANTNHAIGFIYRVTSQYELASEHLERALLHFQKQNDKYQISSILRTLGLLDYRMEKYESSKKLYHSALDVAESIGDNQGVADCHSMLGNIYMEENYYPLAAHHLRAALAVAKEMNLLPTLSHIHKDFAELDSLRGDYASALTNFRKFYEYEQQLLDKENQKQLSELQVRFDAQKKEQENTILKKDQAIQESQMLAQEASIRNTRTIAIASVICALLLMGFVYVLYQANKESKQINETLKLKQEEMEIQKTELQNLSQTKDQWFAMICHDFKQPLTFLQGALALLNEGHISEQEKRILLGEMESRVRNNSILLDNLLYWAQDQMHGILVRKERLNIPQMIQDALVLLKPVAGQSKVEIQNEIKGSPTVWADRYMLQLVLRNLIDNAIKLCTPGNVVQITSQVEQNTFIIHVADSGRAIPEEYLQKLFHFDHRRIIEEIARERGMGVGLLISKDFIEKNEGKIWVNTTSEGNVFSFSLPYGGERTTPQGMTGQDQIPTQIPGS